MIDFKTQTVQVLGRPLRCQICVGTRFWQGSAQLTLDGSDAELGPQGEALANGSEGGHAVVGHCPTLHTADQGYRALKSG